MLLLRKEFLGFLQTCFPGKDVLFVAVVGAVVVVVVVAVVFVDDDETLWPVILCQKPVLKY